MRAGRAHIHKRGDKVSAGATVQTLPSQIPAHARNPRLAGTLPSAPARRVCPTEHHQSQPFRERPLRCPDPSTPGLCSRAPVCPEHKNKSTDFVAGLSTQAGHPQELAGKAYK